MKSTLMITASALSLFACNPVALSGDASVSDAARVDSAAPMFDPMVCRSTTAQPDFMSQDAMGEPIAGTVWSGPAVNATTGQPMVPPGSLVATTYLQLRTDAASQMVFSAVSGRVTAELFAAPGLLAVAIVVSRQCAVARTMSVWASEEAMLRFVTSAAHAEAIARVGEISRGGSVTTTFMANSSGDVTWAEVTRRFEGYSGPTY